MNTLKRLWVALGGPYALFVASMVLLGELGFIWYRLSKRHDLVQASHTSGYQIGVLAVLSAALAGALLGLATGLLLRRFRPQPLPIDPDNPPEETLFWQVEGEEPVRCDCHGKPIPNDSMILVWPQPPKLVCLPKGDAE